MLARHPETDPSVVRPAWGPMMVELYEANRRAQRGELDFWASLPPPHSKVLEIGAGQGLISKELARSRPRLLTLVEPEALHASRLQAAVDPILPADRFQIVLSTFEDGEYEHYDLIAMPYDTLPMFPTRSARQRLFTVVGRSLAAGGVFAVHFRDRSEYERRIAKRREASTRTVRLPSFGDVLVASRFEQNDTEFFWKHCRLTDCTTGDQEEYAFPTGLIDHDEVVAACHVAGLSVIALYSEDGYQPIPEPRGQTGTTYLMRKGCRA